MKNKKPFNRLSKSQQRVAIAKDVLLQLRKKRFRSKLGSYVRIPNLWGVEDNYRQANECILDGSATCQVCAKGALFMSHVMKTNHISLRDVDDIGEYKIKERLKMFSIGQLDLIECAFEKRVIEDGDRILRDYNDINESYTSLSKSAIQFGRKHKKADRLSAIMKNIIKNNGTFKP